MGEDLFKIVDFSERITPIGETSCEDDAEEGVFWDVEDYPFPDDFTPDMIYGKMESCLKDKGHTGRISIWAYVGEKNKTWGDQLLRKTWISRIYFLSGGDSKSSRRDRMILDISLWVMDNSIPAKLIVVADQVKEDPVFFGWLRGFNMIHYSTKVMCRPNDLPESSQWPGSILNDSYSFNDASESSEPSALKCECLWARTITPWTS